MLTGALASESLDSLLPGGLIVNLIQRCAASRRVDCDDRLLLVPPPSPSRMPTEHSGLCRTLLDDGETRCSVPVKHGRQSCPRHTAAYDASYKRYKDAENAAKDLRAAAQTKRGDVHTIPPEDIEPRIKSVCAYIQALESELRLRNEHDERFIGNPDEGHLKRLDALEKQLTHHRDIVEALRARLQRLKPAGQPTPPKHRRHRHRHTVSDPTPQPPTSAPSAPRPFRRRSHGQPNGDHAKSQSVQTGTTQGRKEHSTVFTGQGEEVDEEDHGLRRHIRSSALSLHVFEDSWMGGASGLGPEAEYWGGGVAEPEEAEGRQEESTAVAADGCEDDMSVLAHGQTASCFVEGAANASPPSPSLIELDGSRREPTREDGSSSQEHPENQDTTTSRPAPPSPLPRIVGEYPWVDPEHEESVSGAGPRESHQGGFLKVAFAAILPAAMFVLTRVFARIRNRAPRPA